MDTSEIITYKIGLLGYQWKRGIPVTIAAKKNLPNLNGVTTMLLCLHILLVRHSERAELSSFQRLAITIQLLQLKSSEGWLTHISGRKCRKLVPILAIAILLEFLEHQFQEDQAETFLPLII